MKSTSKIGICPVNCSVVVPRANYSNFDVCLLLMSGALLFVPFIFCHFEAFFSYVNKIAFLAMAFDKCSSAQRARLSVKVLKS